MLAYVHNAPCTGGSTGSVPQFFHKSGLEDKLNTLLKNVLGPCHFECSGKSRFEFGTLARFPIARAFPG